MLREERKGIRKRTTYRFLTGASNLQSSLFSRQTLHELVPKVSLVRRSSHFIRRLSVSGWAVGVGVDG